MRLGFYGHCTVAWSTRPINKSAPFRENEESLVDIVCKHFDAILVNKGVNQGSIERALLDLKKTKQVDVAIIFHPHANRFYLPRTDRDIDLKYFNDFFKDTKAKYIWNVQKDRSRNIIWNIEKTHSNTVQEHFYDPKENIKDVYESVEEFITTLSLYKKYLHNQDVHMNRWYGSLIQIDQYLLAKKIPCLHVIDKNIIPSWFKFQSGTVATYIADFEKDFHVGYATTPNSISKPGQQIMANALIAEIEKIINNQ
jgi:hypothetical protein